MAEATGSSPVSSIPSLRTLPAVGSHEFHRRFGWYAEQVARGGNLLVTRRGKPYVRLLPADDQLPGESPESGEARASAA
jgi:prevent-host-death family protein